MFKVKNPLDMTERKKRVVIRASVKQAVFDRADGKCEYRGCKKSLRWGTQGSGTIRGRFHHIRSPSISPTEKTVRLVCPDHHDRLHEYTVRTKSIQLTGETIKSRQTIRKDTKPKGKHNSRRKRRKATRTSFPDFTKLI